MASSSSDEVSQDGEKAWMPSGRQHKPTGWPTAIAQIGSHAPGLHSTQPTNCPASKAQGIPGQTESLRLLSGERSRGEGSPGSCVKTGRCVPHATGSRGCRSPVSRLPRP